jgi:RNA polymerase sigma-70 factor (ECF subfamily)
MIDWDGIVERDGPAVWRTCWRLLGNRADADECYQETFVAALTLSRRQELATPRAVLLHLAAARSIDRLRSRQRRRKHFDFVEDERLDLETARGSSPRQEAEGAELARSLRRALATLPAKQAEVFVLHAIEGWSYHEISERLGLTGENVGVLIHRARAKLKVLLARYQTATGTGETNAPVTIRAQPAELGTATIPVAGKAK